MTIDMSFFLGGMVFIPGGFFEVTLTDPDSASLAEDPWIQNHAQEGNGLWLNNCWRGLFLGSGRLSGGEILLIFAGFFD